MEKDNLMELIDNMVDRRKTIEKKIDDKNNELIEKGLNSLKELAKMMEHFIPHISKITTDAQLCLVDGSISCYFKCNSFYRGLYIKIENDRYYNIHTINFNCEQKKHDELKKFCMYIGWECDFVKTRTVLFNEWLATLIDNYKKDTQILEERCKGDK